jgi:hypothetical protein
MATRLDGVRAIRTNTFDTCRLFKSLREKNGIHEFHYATYFTVSKAKNVHILIMIGASVFHGRFAHEMQKSRFRICHQITNGNLNTTPLISEISQKIDGE